MAQNPFVTIWRKSLISSSLKNQGAWFTMDLIELRQTSATILCLSCLKHVPQGFNMCPCGVWLRPNQGTMDRIKARFAALITPYYRATVQGRGRKRGHNQWQKDHAKAVDAKRGAKKRGNLPSILRRWQNDEIYHSRRNQFERFRGFFLELISRFEFEFCRRENCIFWTIRIFGVFKVHTHTMWPYMCLCCGLFVSTQFQFECCCVFDGSWYIYIFIFRRDVRKKHETIVEGQRLL